MIKSVEIMNRLVGEGNWITINGLDYESIVVKGGVEMPTLEQFNNTKTIVENEYEKQSYKNKRADEYPSIGDQLDALFHAGMFPTEMAAKIQSIKDKYPKG